MSSPPETDKRGLSALTNQEQGALSTEGFDGPANGALQTEWTVGEDRGSEDKQGPAGSEETDDRRATPEAKTVGEGLVKDGGHEEDTSSSVEGGRRVGERRVRGHCWDCGGVAEKDKEKGWGAGSAKGEGENSAKVGSGGGEGHIGREAKTADAWIDRLSGSQDASLNNVSSNNRPR